jgi:hypothetical protein
LIATRTGLKFADPVAVFGVENRARGPVQERPAAEMPEENGPLWKVTASRLNVRKGPGANAATVGAIERNTTVNVVVSDLPDWLLIRTTKPELEGYVARRFLSPVND